METSAYASYLNDGSSMNRDIHGLVRHIDREIKKIEAELDDVDKLVEKDINEILKAHREVDLQQFQDAHFKALKERRENSLRRAREELDQLKGEILGVLATD